MNIFSFIQRSILLPLLIALSIQACSKDTPSSSIQGEEKPDTPTVLETYQTDALDWTVISGKDQVTLLVKRSFYDKLKNSIIQYKNDVENNFPVQLNIVSGTWTKAFEVRETIKEIADTKGLSGVVLVGDMPMHKFYMHDFANPNPLYYEDFTLKFSNDNVASHYDGKPDLKIWVANLRAVSSPDMQGISEFEAFFKKTHLYYSGGQKIRHHALFAAGWEWPDGAKEAAKSMSPIFSKLETEILINETGRGSKNESLGVTRTNILNAFSENYLMFYIQVHSYEKGHDLENGGQLLATDIIKWPTGALFVVNHGCSAGNWLKASPELNVSQAYVFGSSIGEAVVCQVRTGMVYGHEKMYERLVAGDYVGKAYLAAKKSAEKEMNDEYPKGDTVSGVILIGNPFIYIK